MGQTVGFPPPGTRMRCVALLVLAAAPAGWALPPGRYLEPVWSYASTARLEWVAVADGFAVLATADGEVRILNPATGPDPGVPALSATPGVRLAGAAEGRALLFDHLSIYACELRSPAAWTWRFAAATAPPSDDPEQFPGWNEAVSVPGGPLLATGDGRLLWLAGDDGTPRWELKLGRWSAARLLTHRQHAAVVWSESGRSVAMLLPISAKSPTPTRVTLDDEAPLWLGLTADGLLVVTPQRLTTWSWNGVRHDATPDVQPRRAAAIAAFESPEPRLLLSVGTRPQALDARTGALVWGAWSVDSPALALETLHCAGDALVAMNRLGPVVYDSATGRTLAGCRRATGRLVGWHVTDARLCAVYLTPGFIDSVGELVCVPLGGGRTEAWTLVPTGQVRQTAWTGAHLLVLENHALRAYRLP